MADLVQRLCLGRCQITTLIEHRLFEKKPNLVSRRLKVFGGGMGLRRRREHGLHRFRFKLVDQVIDSPLQLVTTLCRHKILDHQAAVL